MKNQSLPSFPKLHIYKKIRKQPKLIKEIFSILSHYSNEFLKERSTKYLYKLSKTRSCILEHFPKTFSNTEKRDLYMKCLSVKFQNTSYPRKVLGISLSFHLLMGYEKFDEQTLNQILKNLIPGIHILEESIYFYYFRKRKVLSCYFEIEKIRGKHLTFKECIKLKTQLPQKIKDGIEYFSPRVFTPENDDEVFRDIVRLHKEVRSPKDLPHVTVSFQGQNFTAIKFNIVLVRVVKDKEPSIKELLQNLPIKFQFHVHKIDSLKKRHLKETSAFSLELKDSLFFRKNQCVDLLQARKYIRIILEETIGEFRDYNGELLSKQTEQFDLIKKELTKQVQDTSSFEELFFSLLSSNIQLLTSPEIALELCKNFYEIKNEPLENGLASQTFQSNNVFFILIKTNSSLYDSIFSDLPSNPFVTYTTKVIDQNIYHCLIGVNPSDIFLTELVEERLRKIQTASIKDTFHIHFQEGSPPSCHPHLSADIKTLTFCKALFEGLTRLNPKGQIDLALARNVDVSSCKKRYTFTLRPSKWSNGEELTSHHFSKAWKKAISYRSNCIRAKNFFLIKNARRAHLKEISIEKVGIHTPSKDSIIVELEHPAPYFLQLLADPIYSPLYSTDDKEPITYNGPFLLSSHKINEQIELISNPMYWDCEKVKLRKVDISLLQDPQKGYEMYKNKTLDWIGNPFNSIPLRAFQESQTIIRSYEAHFPFWLFCNTKNPKLSVPSIRKALSYAIDREKLTQEILPLQIPAYGIIPEELSSLNTKDHFPKNRIGRALLSFEEGLKEIGYKKENFQLTLNHSDIPEQKKLAYFLKASWEKTFDIQVHLVEKPWNAYWNSFFNQEYEIGGFFSYATHESPFYFMDFFEHYYSNFTKWEHKDYKKNLSFAKQTIDENGKSSFIKKAEMILNNEMPVIPVYSHTSLYSSTDTLKDFILPKFGYADFKWVYFDG